MPSKSGAITWYNLCFLKYSEKDFLGKGDTVNGIYSLSTKLDDNPLLFNTNVQHSFMRLCFEAFLTARMFAQGHAELFGGDILYGATQCTSDLSHTKYKM